MCVLSGFSRRDAIGVWGWITLWLVAGGVVLCVTGRLAASQASAL